MIVNEEILAEARKILGSNEIEITKKGWAVFWCPAHPDEAQAGTTGAPNFGIDLNTGRYNCFRCGFKGGSLASLAKADAASRRGPSHVEHFVCQIRLEPSPTVDRGGPPVVRGRAYVVMVSPRSDAPAETLDGGQYWDELVRTPNGWRIRSRTLRRVERN